MKCKTVILFGALMVCMCFVACQSKTGKESQVAENEATFDSIMIQRIRDFIKKDAEEYGIDDYYPRMPIFPSAQSERLYEIWYEEGYCLYLVNRKDTTIADILLPHPLLNSLAYCELTDKTGIEMRDTSFYYVNNDTLTIQNDAAYIYVDGNNPNGNKKRDTLLFEVSETKYLISGDKFTQILHTDTVLRYYQRSVKYYFEKWSYNRSIVFLYDKIISGDSISDEYIWNALPENKEQYRIFGSEVLAYNIRSRVIDSLVLERAKEQPLFIDAYIKQLPWSEGAAKDLLIEEYFPIFFKYDSIYFNEALQRILPPDELTFFDEAWYEKSHFSTSIFSK